MGKVNLAKWAESMSTCATEEDFIQRMAHTFPLVNATSWLGKHIIRRILAVREIKCLNAGSKEKDENSDRSPRTVSNLQSGMFCGRFEYFCKTLKEYAPDKLPTTPIGELARLAVDLLNEMQLCYPSATRISPVGRKIRQFESFLVSRKEYADARTHAAEIDSYYRAITDLVDKMYDEIDVIERQKRGEIERAASERQVAALTQTAGQIAQDVKATKRAAQKLAKRKTGRRDEKAAVQECCWQYWQMAQKKEKAHDAASGRCTYASAFGYYRRELTEAGVASADELRRHLLARRNRLKWTRWSAKKSGK